MIRVLSHFWDPSQEGVTSDPTKHLVAYAKLYEKGFREKNLGEANFKFGSRILDPNLATGLILIPPSSRP